MNPIPTSTPTPIDSASAARRLAQAWHTQTWLDALPVGERPTTLAEGYEIQRRLAELFGDADVGWKVALGSPNGMRASPSGGPIFGRLRRACLQPSGARLALPAEGGLTLEVETAVTISREVDPAQTPFSPELIGEAFVAFEVVRSRFRDRQAVGQPSFVADDAGFHAFVRGTTLTDFDLAAPAGPAELLADGRVVRGRLLGDDATDVRAALERLWRHIASLGLRLPAGSVVTTGTMTAPFEIAQPGHYLGRAAGATVELTIT